MVEINCSLPFFTKVCSIICGGLIAFMAIQRLLNLSNAKIQDYILSVHFILLGLILVLSEFQIQYVFRNFMLIASLTGRGIYAIFLGTIMLTNNDNIFQLIVAIVLIIVGLLYFILGMKMNYGNNQNNADKEELNSSRVPEIK